jgi:CRP/FNR family transcriptional regulator
MGGSVTSQNALACVDPAHAEAPVASAAVTLHEVTAHCASCAMRGLCLPLGLDADAVERLDELITDRMRVKRKDTLYRPGDRFSAIYAIRLGTFKTLVLAEDGREQITGYHLAGEVIGLDGVGDDRYTCQAIALEDSEVCVLPFNLLDRLTAEVPTLRHNLFRLVSRDLCRDHTMMLLLGSRPAEERLTLFLLDVAERYRARGYSAHEFVLRMTREEIASYLGLQLETVSRLFSSLQEEGLLQVQGRAVKLLDVSALNRLVGQRSECTIAKPLPAEGPDAGQAPPAVRR